MRRPLLNGEDMRRYAMQAFLVLSAVVALTMALVAAVAMHRR